MQPKRLLDICINAFVQFTKDILNTSMSEKGKFLAVKRMWDELWTLPQNIPVYAEKLLQAYLRFMYCEKQDFSLGFLLLLAADVRKIDFNYFAPRPVSTHDKWYFQRSEYHLQVLHITFFNGDIDISALEEIIPYCPSLKELKLEYDVSKTLLALAKKHCPLTVLHIDWIPECLDFWMDLFFGVSNVHPSEILEGIKTGKSQDLKAAWPNLTDLEIGFIELPDDFFVLMWIIYKKLECNINLFEKNIISGLKKYVTLKREVPEFDCLTIKYIEIIDSITDSDTELLLSVASNIDYFYLNFADLSMFSKFWKNLERFSEASLCPRVIHLDSNCDTSTMKMGNLFGKEAKKLLIFGLEIVDLKDLGEFLLDFPALEELYINFYHGLKCVNEKLLANLCFPHITSLSIQAPRPVVHNRCQRRCYNLLFQLFPNLREFGVHGGISACDTPDDVDPMPLNFKKLSELRILKVPHWKFLPDILDIPRDTQKSQRYELYGPALSPDARKVLNSEWNYIFIGPNLGYEQI